MCIYLCICTSYIYTHKYVISYIYIYDVHLYKYIYINIYTYTVYRYTQCIYLGYSSLMSIISHFKHDNSQELRFKYSWSKTKGKEYVDLYEGTQRVKCSNCASEAVCLPVLVDLYIYSINEIFIPRYLFPYYKHTFSPSDT